MDSARSTRVKIVDKIRIDHNSGCWIWTGCLNIAGYGKLSIRNKSYLAHRASYESFVGPIPDGMFICHKCDTPACVRPEHLFVGSQEENVRDMHSKGRAAPTQGINNGNAKLTETDIAEIRSSALPLQAIADKYRVARSTVSRVRTGVARRKPTKAMAF